MAVVLDAATPGRTQADGKAQESAVHSIGQNMHIGITSFSSWMLGVGAIIGSMAWLFHSYMIAKAGTLAAVAAWLVAALAFVPVTLILAELSSMFPSAGGPYVYKYYAFKRLIPRGGELLGFLTGWMFWACLIAGYACMSCGLVNLLGSCIFENGQTPPVWFGPTTIFILFFATTLINLMRVSHTAFLNNVFTIMKFVMAASFGALVLVCPSTSLANLLNPVNLGGDTNFFGNICAVLTVAIGGFGGIELIACASSETKNASKSVPRAMFMTLLSVALIYAGMCAAVGAACAYTLGPDKASSYIAGTNFTATVPGVTGFLVGTFWGRIASALVVASIVGCAIGGVLASARIGFSMARTGLFPKQFGQLDDNTKVPSYALWFQFACLCTLGISANLFTRFGIIPDAYTFLGETFSFMYILLVVMYGVSIVSLRYTDPEMPRPFRIGKNGNAMVWVMAALTICIFGFVAFGCTKPMYQIAGLVILAAGLPIYAYYRWRR